MKVFNLIWGFSLGAGIDKCFITYDSLKEYSDKIDVISVCIRIKSKEPVPISLKKINAEIIEINSRLDFSWISKLAELIKNSNSEVVFTHGFNGPVLATVVRLFKGVKTPIICSYHGLYHAPTFGRKFLEPLFNFIPRVIYRNLAKKVICVEKYSKEFLITKRVPESKIVTVYNGVETLNNINQISLDEFNIPKDKILILTASRISEVKGLNYLIEALSILNQETSKEFHYIMLGDGPDLKMLKTKVKNLQLEDKISFIGYQNNIPSWLKAVDIFALPSLHEYHSIGLLEAMRSGKGIVATDVGGNSESIRDLKDGILVPSKNPKQFAKGLLTLVESENKRVQYGKSAMIRFYDNFTEDKMKENLITALTT